MAKQVEGIVIEFQGNTLKFDNSVDGMKKAINTLKKEVGLFNKQLKSSDDSAKSIDTLTKKIKNLEQQEKLAKQMLEEWNNRLANLNSKGISTNSEEWKKNIVQIEEANKRVIDIETQLRKAKEQLDSFVGTDVDKLTKKLEATDDKLGDIGENLNTLGKTIEPISDKASDFLEDGIDSAIEFEDAFARVTRVLGDANATTINELKDGIRELSTELPTSADEIAGVVEQIATLGVADKDLLDFTKVMLQLGDTTNMSAEEAGEAIAKLYNITGADVSSVDKFASTLLDLGIVSASTEKDIANMALNISSAGNLVGMTEQEILALATALSSVGLESKAGGSSISKTITEIDKAVALNSDTLATWAETAGMSVEEFKQLWSADATSGLVKVLVGMTDLSKGGENLNVLLDQLGITEIRQSDALRRLAGDEESVTKYLNVANKAWEENASLGKNAETIYDTTSSQIEILKNTFEEFARSLGEVLLPLIKSITGVLQNISKWLNSLSPTTKKVITTITSIVAVVAPLLIGAGKLLIFISNIITAITPFINIISKVVLFIKELWSWVQAIIAVVKIVLSFINPIYLAIAGVVTALVLLWKHCEPFREFIKNILDGIKKLWEKFKETNWIEKLGEKFGWFGTILGGIIELIKTFIEWIGKAIQMVSDFFGGIAEWVGEKVSNIGDFISEIFSSGGYGAIENGVGATMQSGGYGNQITLNASFTANGNLNEAQAIKFADLMSERINEKLGMGV